jgi:hypothetical protein
VPSLLHLPPRRAPLPAPTSMVAVPWRPHAVKLPGAPLLSQVAPLFLSLVSVPRVLELPCARTAPLLVFHFTRSLLASMDTVGLQPPELQPWLPVLGFGRAPTPFLAGDGCCERPLPAAAVPRRVPAPAMVAAPAASPRASSLALLALQLGRPRCSLRARPRAPWLLRLPSRTSLLRARGLLSPPSISLQSRLLSARRALAASSSTLGHRLRARPQTAMRPVLSPSRGPAIHALPSCPSRPLLYPCCCTCARRCSQLTRSGTTTLGLLVKSRPARMTLSIASEPTTQLSSETLTSSRAVSSSCATSFIEARRSLMVESLDDNNCPSR